MNFEVVGVDYDATVLEVKKSLAILLHSKAFTSYLKTFQTTVEDKDVRPGVAPNSRPHLLNFHITLSPSTKTGYNNNGTGLLTLPTPRAGDAFLSFIKKGKKFVTVRGRRLFFKPSEVPLKPDTVEVINKVSFQNPDEEAKRLELKKTLDAINIRIRKVSFGNFCLTLPRVFAQEWEYDCMAGYPVSGVLTMEWEHKLFRIFLTVEDENKAIIDQSIVVRFANINEIFVGSDMFTPYVLFSLYSAPLLEDEYVHRDPSKRLKYRRRIESLDAAHAQVATYATQVCVTLYDLVDLETFTDACMTAKVTRPKHMAFSLEKHLFFSRKRMGELSSWYARLDSWPVAFQIEALLRNGILNTEEVKCILEPTAAFCKERGVEATAALLRAFNERVRNSTSRQDLSTVFSTLGNESQTRLLRTRTSGTHMCYHVTVTPTRIILEGPYPDKSNSVVSNFDSEYFLRAAFKDEDGQPYRWDREVDSREILQTRVGDVLRNGIDLAGRHFDFLAYSNSAIRSHCVWFMAPFCHASRGLITADIIRSSLGDFSKTSKWPARYAARMAQRFTATQRSVWISKEQWSKMDDLSPIPVKGRYEVHSDPFTDGVGTMSLELRDRVQSQICDHNPSIKPTAYQIRFLGFKGMLSVDASLVGIHMRLRPSMEKFQAYEDEGYLEIADAFYKPGRMHLNQPYIMILEDRGVPTDVFLRLQTEAIEKVYSVKKDLTSFSQFSYKHHLGAVFRFPELAERLANRGLNLSHEDPNKQISFPFFTRLVAYSTAHVLREIKYKSRIPVEGSWQLVGVADEGMEWIKQGARNVRLLEEGEIYACIQEPGEEPIWLEGPCLVSRSPTVHPGDVQQAIAIGRPPANRFCAFACLKNCVVFNTRGSRSLPSCLGGGDLDGDLYDICMYSDLQIPRDSSFFKYEPARYPKRKPKALSDGRESNISDVIDFIVEYIQNDMVGILSVNHLVTADQSKNGVFDENCIKLAELCSQAVDYPKSGWYVNMKQQPRRLLPYNPDWREGEVTVPYKLYYPSQRALGIMYRAITLEDPSIEVVPKGPPVLSNLVNSMVQPYISTKFDPRCFSQDVKTLFKYYQEEMQIISVTHTLNMDPAARLSEEEIVVGTIMGSYSNHRMRQDRIQRLKAHTEALVKDVGFLLVGPVNEDPQAPDFDVPKLKKAWEAWMYGACNARQFGANSFALISLSILFDLIEKIEEKNP